MTVTNARLMAAAFTAPQTCSGVASGPQHVTSEHVQLLKISLHFCMAYGFTIITTDRIVVDLMRRSRPAYHHAICQITKD